MSTRPTPAPVTPSSSRNTRVLVLGALLLVALIAIYAPAFAWLGDTWWNDDEYSHGMLVPLISGYMVWIRRAELRALPIAPSPILGGLALAFAALLLIAGRAGALILSEAVSFLILVPALVLLLGGRAHLRMLALPLAYLQFMVPWMDEILERLHMPFQLLSADLAVRMLNLLDYNVLHEGKFIRIPGILIEVARECSGVRFFVSIIAIGIPLVFFTQKSYRRAAFVLITSMGLAVLTNGLRVALAAMSASRWGADALHGPGHILQGWFVAQVGIIALFIVNTLVIKFWPGKGVLLYQRAPRLAAMGGNTNIGFARNFTVVTAVLITVALYLQFMVTPPPREPRMALTELPTSIGEWRGANSDWIDGEKYFPNADHEVAREYRNAEGESVYLYIAYFASQERGKAVVNYRANALAAHAATQWIPTDDGQRFQAVHSSPKLNGTQFEVLQWYRMPETDLASRYKAKARSITDALLERHNNAAVVLIARRAEHRDTASDPSPAVLTFGGKLQPIVREVIP